MDLMICDKKLMIITFYYPPPPLKVINELEQVNIFIVKMPNNIFSANQHFLPAFQKFKSFSFLHSNRRKLDDSPSVYDAHSTLMFMGGCKSIDIYGR